MPSDGNKTRMLIIKNAIKLFKEKGYQNVSVQDICDRSNIKRASFYYHFKTKESIIDSYYDNLELPQTDYSKLITSSNCWLKLWLLTLPSIRWTIDMGAELLSVVFMLNFQNGGTSFFPLQEASQKDLIINIIKKGQATGQFKNSKNPVDLYHNMRNSIIGIAAVWCMKNGSFDEEEEIRQTLITLFQPDESLISEAAEYEKSVIQKNYKKQIHPILFKFSF